MREALLGSVICGRFQASGPLNLSVGVCLDAFCRTRKVGLGGSSAAWYHAESQFEPSLDGRGINHGIAMSMDLAAGAGAPWKHYSAFDFCWRPVHEGA